MILFSRKWRTAGFLILGAAAWIAGQHSAYALEIPKLPPGSTWDTLTSATAVDASSVQTMLLGESMRKETAAGNFAAVEAEAKRIREGNLRLVDGRSALPALYSGIFEALHNVEKYQGEEGVERYLKRWRDEQTSSVTALVAEAQNRNAAAWMARGNGFAGTVKQEQWKVFREHLHKAKKALQEAEKNPVLDPMGLAMQIHVGKGLGEDRERMDAVVQKAIEKCPDHEYVYQAMAEYLLPRWYGEPGDLEKFAADVAQKVPKPAGDVMYCYILETVRQYERRQIFEATSFKWPQIRDAYETLIKTYPSSRNYRRFCNLAVVAEDRETAHRMFTLVGDKWEDGVIQAYFRSRSELEGYRRWAAGGPHPDEKTPLMAAIELGDVDALTSAVQAGADVNAPDARGELPLIAALGARNQQVTKKLISLGASLQGRRDDGFNVAEAAVRADNTEVVELLLKDGVAMSDTSLIRKEFSLLHFAALVHGTKVVRFLLSTPGVDVQLATESGETPLHYAAETGNMEIARMLIAKGAKVNTGDGRNIVPLHKAAMNGHEDMIQYLLDSGADANIRSMSGISALDTAERRNKESAAQLLRRHTK